MNTFEQTVEEYKEEVMLSQDNITMEEFYSLELELDNMTVELYKESNNLEAVNFAENDLSIRALAIANGVGIEQSKDFTVESSKGSLVTRLWENLKLMLKKARMFMTKWVSKAMAIFLKHDEIRKSLAYEIKGLSHSEFNQTQMPDSLIKSIGKFFSQGVMSKPGTSGTSKSTFLSFLTFVENGIDENLKASKEKLETLTGYKSDDDVIAIKSSSGGRFIIIKTNTAKPKDVIIDTATITKDALNNIFKPYADIKPDEKMISIKDLNLDKNILFKTLLKTKKDLQKEIDDAYSKFKEEGKTEMKDVKDITRASKSIANGIVWIKGIIGTAKDAVVVGEAVSNAISGYIKKHDIGLSPKIKKLIDSGDFEAMREYTVNPASYAHEIEPVMEELYAYGELDDKHFKAGEQYERDMGSIRINELGIADVNKGVGRGKALGDYIDALNKITEYVSDIKYDKYEEVLDRIKLTIKFAKEGKDPGFEHRAIKLAKSREQRDKDTADLKERVAEKKKKKKASFDVFGTLGDDDEKVFDDPKEGAKAFDKMMGDDKDSEKDKERAKKEEQVEDFLTFNGAVAKGTSLKYGNISRDTDEGTAMAVAGETVKAHYTVTSISSAINYINSLTGDKNKYYTDGQRLNRDLRILKVIKSSLFDDASENKRVVDLVENLLTPIEISIKGEPYPQSEQVLEDIKDLKETLRDA